MGSFYRYYKDLLRDQFEQLKCWLSGVSVQPVVERESSSLPSPEQLEIASLKEQLDEAMKYWLLFEKQSDQASKWNNELLSRIDGLKREVESERTRKAKEMQGQIDELKKQIDKPNRLAQFPTFERLRTIDESRALEPLEFDMNIRQRIDHSKGNVKSY